MSDSSSDDEHEKRLREAIDPTLLTNDIYKASEKDSAEVENVKNEAPKSQRYVEIEDTFYEERVPPSMQDFFYKKLSQRLERMYEFCNFEDENRKEAPQKEYGVKLLKEHKTFIKYVSVPSDDPPLNMRRPKIKRRIVDEDTEDIAMNRKLELVSVDGEYVLSKKETISWAKRHKGEVFRYKTSKNKTLFYIEPENEFTKLRKKNCWSEKYISTKGKKIVVKK